MEDKDFIVNIGPQGTFRESGNYQTLPADIDAMFQRFEASGVSKIALYFHGGLVSESSGLESARAIAPVIKAAGAEPICIVWETGLIETIANNLSKIGQTGLFDKIRNAVIKRVSDKLGFNGTAARGSAVAFSDAEIYSELKKEYPFEAYTRETLVAGGRGDNDLEMMIANEATLKAELSVEFGRIIEADEDFQKAIDVNKLSPGAANQPRGILSSISLIKSLVSIAIRVIRRFFKKRDHDFYPTVIEEILREFYIAEIGSWVWDNMKVKSLEMWNTNKGPVTENSFAGTYLLKKIAAYISTHPGTSIDIIGHSAGSCATCHLLKRTAELHPGLKFRNILFLAPACRMDLFKEEILSKPDRFSSLRIFTMSDENEKKDILVKYLYTHSLLYLISGILEEGGQGYDEYILGMERYYLDVSPYKDDDLITNIKTYLYQDPRERMVLSKSAAGALDGFKTQSLKHGDFHTEKETLASIAYIISQ